MESEKVTPTEATNEHVIEKTYYFDIRGIWSHTTIIEVTEADLASKRDLFVLRFAHESPTPDTRLELTLRYVNGTPTEIVSSALRAPWG